MAEGSSREPEIVFLLDVDNTLLDNDRVRGDLAAQIRELVDDERAERFWFIYEQVRDERDFVDYPWTLARFHAAYPDERAYPEIARIVLSHPYENYLFPRVRETLAHLRQLGRVVILSDGDPVYQPAKIARAGLHAAAEGNVLVFAHKEAHLGDVQRLFPAPRYALVDDKPRVLAAAKDVLGERLVTVHVCQGKYAHAEEHRTYPDADRTYETIGELAGVTLHDLLLPADRGTM